MRRFIRWKMQKFERIGYENFHSSFVQDYNKFEKVTLTITHGRQLHQFYFLLWEKAIEAGALTDIDLSVAKMVGQLVFEKMCEKGIPKPKESPISMYLSICRVMTMYYGIEMEFFSELGLRHRKDEYGDHKKFEFSMLLELEKWKCCSKEIAIHVLTLLEGEWVPKMKTAVAEAMAVLTNWPPNKKETAPFMKLETGAGDPRYLQVCGGSFNVIASKIQQKFTQQPSCNDILNDLVDLKTSFIRAKKWVWKDTQPKPPDKRKDTQGGDDSQKKSKSKSTEMDIESHPATPSVTVTATGMDTESHSTTPSATATATDANKCKECDKEFEEKEDKNELPKCKECNGIGHTGCMSECGVCTGMIHSHKCRSGCETCKKICHDKCKDMCIQCNKLKHRACMIACQLCGGFICQKCQSDCQTCKAICHEKCLSTHLDFVEDENSVPESIPCIIMDEHPLFRPGQMKRVSIAVDFVANLHKNKDVLKRYIPEALGNKYQKEEEETVITGTNVRREVKDDKTGNPKIETFYQLFDTMKLKKNSNRSLIIRNHFNYNDWDMMTLFARLPDSNERYLKPNSAEDYQKRAINIVDGDLDKIMMIHCWNQNALDHSVAKIAYPPFTKETIWHLRDNDPRYKGRNVEGVDYINDYPEGVIKMQREQHKASQKLFDESKNGTPDGYKLSEMIHGEDTAGFDYSGHDCDHFFPNRRKKNPHLSKNENSINMEIINPNY